MKVKLTILIIVTLFITGGFIVYKMEQSKFCLAFYSPIEAQNIFTREIKVFSNDCGIPLWWTETNT